MKSRGQNGVLPGLKEVRKEKGRKKGRGGGGGAQQNFLLVIFSNPDFFSLCTSRLFKTFPIFFFSLFLSIASRKRVRERWDGEEKKKGNKKKLKREVKPILRGKRVVILDPHFNCIMCLSQNRGIFSLSSFSSSLSCFSPSLFKILVAFQEEEEERSISFNVVGVVCFFFRSQRETSSGLREKPGLLKAPKRQVTSRIPSSFSYE